jgi:hypothetical protein
MDKEFIEIRTGVWLKIANIESFETRNDYYEIRMTSGMIHSTTWRGVYQWFAEETFRPGETDERHNNND